MASKQKATPPGEALPSEHGRFWQPPEKRTGISEEGRKWQEENAEAAEAWASWIEKNGVPLPPRF
ncbi:MAG: type II toxin-antitoxin system CcdA family antitoxin [Devosia sp.]